MNLLLLGANTVATVANPNANTAFVNKIQNGENRIHKISLDVYNRSLRYPLSMRCLRVKFDPISDPKMIQM